MEANQDSLINTNFVVTDEIKAIIDRASLYLECGLPINFNGPAGTGKTTMALLLARKLSQPYILVCGDEDFSSTDLRGSNPGIKSKKVYDNFIHSVYKEEVEVTNIWRDNRITVACKKGYTLIYDEFTRSRPESNNILLTVLEEKILQLPPERGNSNFFRVDPNFRAIFTSNPQEYAGVYQGQNALLDRVITIKLNGFDQTTVVEILKKHSKISSVTAVKIVQFIDALKKHEEFKGYQTLRGAIKLALVLKSGKVKENMLEDICVDIFNREDQEGLIRQTCQEIFRGDKNV